MSDHHSVEEQDDLARGYHGIPDDAKLQAMSYIKLCETLQSCEKDSTKFHVVEREVKKRLAKDQAKINRSNIGFGACIGGMFGLVGVILGGYLKDSPSPQQVAPSASVQQVQKSGLTPIPPVGNFSPSTPTVSQPTTNPAPVQKNAQQSKRNP